MLQKHNFLSLQVTIDMAMKYWRHIYNISWIIHLSEYVKWHHLGLLRYLWQLWICGELSNYLSLEEKEGLCLYADNFFEWNIRRRYYFLCCLIASIIQMAWLDHDLQVLVIYCTETLLLCMYGTILAATYISYCPSISLKNIFIINY